MMDHIEEPERQGRFEDQDAKFLRELWRAA
jgi:hypothetical protein